MREPLGHRREHVGPPVRADRWFAGARIPSRTDSCKSPFPAFQLISRTLGYANIPVSMPSPLTQTPASWTRNELCEALAPDGLALCELLAVAAGLRDQSHGRVVSFSRNVFLPLTTLCRDYCTYCTFRADPGDSGARIMSPDEVLGEVQRAQGRGCTEALFSLGDKPEAEFIEMRQTLAALGYRTTLGYLDAVCRRVLAESSLIPHSNPGLMPRAAMQHLAESNGSLGLMLENSSDRLMTSGMPHHRAPDKDPRRRIETIENAGRHRIPFTTGILFGIGETIPECVDSLLTIRALHERYGHIQEVIVQNFRAKADTSMATHVEPNFDQVLRTAAVARVALGAEMNIQVPPNLSGSDYPRLLDAGINDWGGISPLTPDYINPEAPWPHLQELKRQTQLKGFELRERLAVYPRYIEWAAAHSPLLDQRLRELADAKGYRRGGL